MNFKYLQPSANTIQGSSQFYLEDKVLCFKLSFPTGYFVEPY